MHVVVLCYEALVSLHERELLLTLSSSLPGWGRKQVPDGPRAVGAPSDLVPRGDREGGEWGAGDGEGDMGRVTRALAPTDTCCWARSAPLGG